MSFAKLKKELKSMSKEQIANLVLDMYQKVPKAKDFLEAFATYDIQNLVEKYKKEIKRYCTLTYDFQIKDTEARKLIREIRKMKIDELTVQLELYYCVCCIKLIDEYGSNISDNFCNALDKMFESAMTTIKQNGWESDYADEINDLQSIGSNYGFFY